VEDRIHEEEDDDRHDGESHCSEERELDGRPEVDVHELQPDLLGRGALGRLLCELFGNATHTSSFVSASFASGAASSTTMTSATSASTATRLRSLFLARAIIRSSSANRAKTTPMVSLPLAGTSATADLTTLPLARTTSTSSSSPTMSALARCPRSSLYLPTLMPSPPRFWRRYCSTAVRFAKPPSVAMKTNASFSGSAGSTDADNSSSSSRKFIPITPEVDRPIGRRASSVAVKRIDMPF